MYPFPLYPIFMSVFTEGGQVNLNRFLIYYELGQNCLLSEQTFLLKAWIFFFQEILICSLNFLKGFEFLAPIAKDKTLCLSSAEHKQVLYAAEELVAMIQVTNSLGFFYFWALTFEGLKCLCTDLGIQRYMPKSQPLFYSLRVISYLRHPEYQLIPQ